MCPVTRKVLVLNSQRLDSKRKFIRSREITQAYTRHQLMKKAKFRQQEESKTLHEGDTYRPGIDLQVQPIDRNGSISLAPCVESAYIFFLFRNDRSWLGCRCAVINSVW